uniref:Uncharacterized protein n=1 Tax=Chenopodium quinoa TaxID=63459 RepID=A0A803L7F4_CHEQI
MALYLGSPTSDFNGFTNLQSLELFFVDLAAETFTSITMNCRHLAFIKLYHCTGMKHLVINVPSLKSLVIEGYHKSLEINNGQHLVNISLDLEEDWLEDPSTGTVKTIKTLADSYELRRLHFGDALGCQWHLLDRLCLTAIDLRDVDVFHVTIGMVQSCPCIKELDIEWKRTWCESSLQDVVIPSINNSKHKVDCNAEYKLFHLRK